MLPYNFAQPATDAIAGNGAANCARGNESGLKRRSGILCFKNAEDQEFSALNPALVFYQLKFRSVR